VSHEYEPPRGYVEEILEKIWKELLRIDRVGRRDNFFELGGHSLHGMKLIAKIFEQLAVDLSVTTVFQFPTIKQMAVVVESLRSLNCEPRSSEISGTEKGVI
jgi:surfactin family lipopeptide synthetase A